MSFPIILSFPKGKPHNGTGFLPIECMVGGGWGRGSEGGGAPWEASLPASSTAWGALAGAPYTLLEGEVVLCLASHAVSVQKKLSAEDELPPTLLQSLKTR